MRGTRGKYAKLVFEHSTVLAKKVAAALLESLDDLDPERLTFVGSAKVCTIQNYSMAQLTSCLVYSERGCLAANDV